MATKHRNPHASGGSVLKEPKPINISLETGAGDGYRRLALAVIHSAVVEAFGELSAQNKPYLRQNSAATFLLKRNPGLGFWCAVAGLNTEHLQRAIQERFESHPAYRDLDNAVL